MKGLSGLARLRWFTVVAALVVVACDEPRHAAPSPAPAAPPAEPAAAPDEVVAAPSLAALALETAADPALALRGRELVTKHDCIRCHTIEAVAPPEAELDCVGCHRDILAGKLAIPPAELAGYQQRIHSLVDVPMLVPGDRLRRTWIAGFLADTHDLRPNLEPSMPRLALPTDDVAAIAAFLAPGAEAAVPVLGDATRGRALLEHKGCGTCHRMTGVDPLPAVPPPVTIEPAALALGQRLAPDLAHTRVRLRPAALLTWLQDPAKVKPGTEMPTIPLTEAEAKDVAAYLVHAPLGAVEAEPVPVRLPVLARAVTYEEVHERIFHRTCRHCHSDPEQVIGDGGPGYHGGFGFPRRALDLNSYTGIRSGSLDDRGERRSVFAALPDGTPRIVAHLMARHAEVAGRPIEGVRGMPLGLPPVALEDIQLLETWITQGRKPPAEDVAP
jgi:cytochrome c2